MVALKYLQAETAGAIDTVARYLKQGKLAIFPTDTVYGVGADAWNEAAILKLYQVKQRPFSKGIPILLADINILPKVVQSVPAVAEAYIKQYWPGALTLIMPKQPTLPSLLSPNENIAIRVPDDGLTRALIRAAGGAVATSSANLSGEPPALTASQAVSTLATQVAAALDNGPTPGALASTVLDCTVVPPRILRHGPISAADLGLAAS